MARGVLLDSVASDRGVYGDRAIIAHSVYARRVKAIAPQFPIAQVDTWESISSPSILAEMRQELCEAFPFLGSYQGGLYCHNGVACGVLLDSVASDRDVCGGRVIITHSGGKSTQNVETEIRSLEEDQRMDDTRIKALHNNLVCKFPIAIIVGDKRSSIQTRVPHRYNMLKWFKVTHSIRLRS
ncbi:Similar to hypothetical protein AOL_s00078g427 [Arthrobotrys oligospora ATCC 24927]; acc. no. EGX49394 [Pyronema omphalodes CBS 100304]|uniref:Uncharacterized protein n=1 Tax=Pyronema omphalodes (strain CBS 100304) TaxID=1076935 RepID=U4L852_PYROM|nr:Similar to hypothetical protein AOL_s00078g427 [Arthrobotrys oligospora ATCC 24927]; acc. no. EGX49394 [Pyronema omphalodes CBS 100304]